MELIVTHEDYLASSHTFGDTNNCPLAIAAKRQFNSANISAGPGSILNHGTGNNYRVAPWFGMNAFNTVKNGGSVPVQLTLIP